MTQIRMANTPQQLCRNQFVVVRDTRSLFIEQGLMSKEQANAMDTFVANSRKARRKLKWTR